MVLTSVQGLGTLSWITVLFPVLLMSNAFGLIPFSEAITGKSGVTLGLSFAVWGAITYTGALPSERRLGTDMSSANHALSVHSMPDTCRHHLL